MRMATKVQRKVLWWMIDNGGELYISTGNKRVLFAYTDAFGKQGEMFCKGNQNLTGGLIAQKLAFPMFEYGKEHVSYSHEENGVLTVTPGKQLTKEEEWHKHRFKITEAGIKAAGKERPDPDKHSNVPHSNKVYRRKMK